jgi:hypothetical protein
VNAKDHSAPAQDQTVQQMTQKRLRNVQETTVVLELPANHVLVISVNAKDHSAPAQDQTVLQIQQPTPPHAKETTVVLELPAIRKALLHLQNLVPALAKKQS